MALIQLSKPLIEFYKIMIELKETSAQNLIIRAIIFEVDDNQSFVKKQITKGKKKMIITTLQ